ncbi:MAG: hypothetical protein OI74_06680 [Gammaproteobacteria bacterium (ex Lamellibrachia satsuma)]|nr:MAG: hypothetical protein HPY30_08295 [Gammaproteobacteria bacterium (ex Lamellibrachia satsuma)]RRS33746.1 MAG: hypothetical protein OI74_06680 [Gammaproteobacteria bacterium (ex Lamellibrachia satsuma)]RRS37540.1 MAG: hypothetical protein NV67_00310 [Gammaproteobacteria bacterium (ex Lamellibrachia satsuma)]
MSDQNDIHDERISHLYKQGGSEQPSPDLDSRIRDAAQQAVKRRKRPFYLVFSPKGHKFGLIRRADQLSFIAAAAVLMLSFGLVIRLFEPVSMLEPEVPVPMLMEQEEAGQPMESSSSPAMDFAGPAFLPSAAPKKKAAKNSMKPRREIQSMQAERAGKEVRTLPKLEKHMSRQAVPAQMQDLECDGVSLPDSDSKKIWIEQMNRLKEDGDLEGYECLHQAYLERFWDMSK